MKLHFTLRLTEYQPPPAPVPGPKAPAPAVGPNAAHRHELHFPFGVISGEAFPTPFPELELKFQDDSGADVLQIWKSDLVALTPQPDPTWPVFEYYTPAVVGFIEIENATGTNTVQLIVCLEINMRAYNPANMNAVRPYMKTNWTKIFCGVDDHNEHEPGAPGARLGGPWLRHALYTATAPEDLHRLVVSTHKTGLTRVRTVDHTRATAPHVGALPDFEALFDMFSGAAEAGRPYEYRDIALS